MIIAGGGVPASVSGLEKRNKFASKPPWPDQRRSTAQRPSGGGAWRQPQRLHPLRALAHAVQHRREGRAHEPPVKPEPATA